MHGASKLTLQQTLQVLHCLWSAGGMFIRLVGIQHVEDMKESSQREEAVGKIS